MTRRPHPRFSLSTAIAAVLLLATGCGDREPTGTELRTGLRVGEVAHAITAPIAFSAGRYSRTIGPDGGILHFGIGRVQFPAGAVDRPTTITATVDGETIGVTFSPHGLIFPTTSQPTLLLDDSRARSGQAHSHIVYVDTNGVILELLQTEHHYAGRASARLRHFSPYILAQN